MEKKTELQKLGIKMVGLWCTVTLRKISHTVYSLVVWQWAEATATWVDGKIISGVGWKPNGEQCPETNIVDGSGIAITYNLDGTVEGV